MYILISVAVAQLVERSSSNNLAETSFNRLRICVENREDAFSGSWWRECAYLL